MQNSKDEAKPSRRIYIFFVRTNTFFHTVSARRRHFRLLQRWINLLDLTGNRLLSCVLPWLHSFKESKLEAFDSAKLHDAEHRDLRLRR